MTSFRSLYSSSSITGDVLCATADKRITNEKRQPGRSYLHPMGGFEGVIDIKQQKFVGATTSKGLGTILGCGGVRNQENRRRGFSSHKRVTSRGERESMIVTCFSSLLMIKNGTNPWMPTPPLLPSRGTFRRRTHIERRVTIADRTFEPATKRR